MGQPLQSPELADRLDGTDALRGEFTTHLLEEK